MSLQHPHSEIGIYAVKIYGPKVMFDRGPTMAFNVFDWKEERINLALVQNLTNRNEVHWPRIDVTATIGFLTSFENIYRLWVLVSRFLDADFLEKEKWRYKAINQKTIEI
ncbi:molybdenum cofactor sulfurase-like [Gossypium australe]|uniref:Molybdenum cofactor sulfurase-like n=1 Tax=Gossypium australe TaxID=47621 RepID=A0A5B6VE16_9ROSI|nr:molybdenum cofactor sulfurase-like [Gossypium australe]